MNLASIFLLLTLPLALNSCKTGKGFIKSKKEKIIVLTTPPTPRIYFLLETGDTLKFSSSDVASLYERQIKKEIKTQGYLSNQPAEYFSKTLRQLRADTLIVQKLSAVGDQTISGTFDSWIAHKLVLNGKTAIALKDSSNNPSELKYIFTKDYLGGQQFTFFTMNNRKIYSAIILFGE